jgi:type II secretory pathway component PulK
MAVDSYFTVYGGDGININMASPAVMMTLDPGIGQDTAEAIAAFRAENAFRSAEDLTKIAGFSSSVATRLKNVIHYKSNFFLISLRAERGGLVRNFEAVAERKAGGVEIVNWRE